MMKIDVIITVYQPTEKLKQLLKAIRLQTVLPENIFLMHTEDGCDIAYAKEVCKGIPVQEIMVRKEDFDHGGTRDMAVRRSLAEIVVLMTQDAVPADRMLLERLTGVFLQDEKIAAAYARQKAGEDSHVIEQYTRNFNYPLESKVKSQEDLQKLGIKTYFCSNVCAAYRRDIYLQTGGFEKNMIFNEDMVYAASVINAGYKIAYAADAVVMHAHSYSYMEQLRRNFDQGVSQADYPQIFENVKSESEGIRLVKKTALYLIEKKKPLQIFRLLILSMCKYLGFLLGKNYKKLPKWLIIKVSMNTGYWKNRGI